MNVISLFDYTGNIARPWAEAGYNCFCVDSQHRRGETQDGRIIWVGADARDWLPPSGEYAAAFFAPPCTDIAVSGARWFKDKGLGALIRALELFKRSVDLAELLGCPYLIENPVSTVSKYWRAPDYIFNPCDYGGYIEPGGDAYTKKTCLWTGNGFKMPDPKPVDPLDGSKMHLLPPTPERANLRSATPEGFARAIFEANAPSKKNVA